MEMEVRAPVWSSVQPEYSDRHNLAKLWGSVMFPPYFPLQKLTSIKIQNDKMRTGNLPANMKKNRVLQIIPCKSPLPTPKP